MHCTFIRTFDFITNLDQLFSNFWKIQKHRLLIMNPLYQQYTYIAIFRQIVCRLCCDDTNKQDHWSSYGYSYRNTLCSTQMRLQFDVHHHSILVFEFFIWRPSGVVFKVFSWKFSMLWCELIANMVSMNMFFFLVLN